MAIANGSTASATDILNTLSSSGYVVSGTDANKSATPAVGQIYVATDTLIMYICYVVNTWTAINSTDGWTATGETWTYASATTFTVSGDVTAKYPKGTKLKLTQTTAKYFYVIGTSYGAPNTTITVTGGSDYTVANAAITSPYYSYQETPQGHPVWFNWVTTAVGFTAAAVFTTSVFRVIGSQIMIRGHNLTGTSNATNFTFTLPIASVAANVGIAPALVTDNTSTTTLGRVDTASSSTTATLYTGASGGNWTNSGTKTLYGVQFVYGY